MRVGPNTLSFATVEAQKTVHNGKTDDGKYFTKFGTIEWLLGVMVWPAPNLLTTTDADAHQRLRKAVQPAFTAREHRKQGPILHKWTDGWIHGLEALCARGEEVDMTESISQLVWNQLGDLAFGEPLPRSQLRECTLTLKSRHELLITDASLTTNRKIQPPEKARLQNEPVARVYAVHDQPSHHRVHRRMVRQLVPAAVPPP